MRLGGKFLKAGECSQGDVITIKDSGEWVESRFEYDDGSKKQQCQFTINHNGEEKTMSFNKTNREVCIEAWGRETKEWVGKQATIVLKEVEVAGEDKTVIRLKPNQEG